MKAADITGQRFGRLVAVCVAKDQNGKRAWQCLCDCGATSIVSFSHLNGGDSSSCGCLALELKKLRAATHGLSKTEDGSLRPEYYIWSAMKRRCGLKTDSNYGLYGGKGIKVCERWANDFAAFYSDMGPRPSPRHSIDRIDGRADYSPENCRWASATEQVRNRSTTVRFEHNGRSMTAIEWAKELGVDYKTIMARKYLGWSDEKIITYGQKSTCAP